MTPTVGIFGLGLVGKALTRRLIAAQCSVMGSDPNPVCETEFAALGGQVKTPDTIWTAPVILAAVFDTDQLATLIDDAPLGTGHTLVSTSTCDPDRMADLEARAAAKDIHLIEAPLSGTSKDLGDGNAVFLVGGDPDRIAELDWLWRILGRGHHYVGAIGNGNRAKLAVNLVLGLNRAALAEGLVFADSIGLDPADFLPLLQDTAAFSSVMPSKGPKMVERDFTPLGRIAQSAKDFNLIRGLAQVADQHLPFATTYQEMMDLGLKNGNGDLDNAAVLLSIEAARPKH